jgi:uncharacterized protein (UPF0548 family)
MTAPLPAADVSALESAAFTYSEIGATATVTPSGFQAFTRNRRLNRRDFQSAAEELLAWRVHERAGLTVAASSHHVTAGAVVKMTVGIKPLALHIPCRVVYLIEEPQRSGFAYGTLPGHPESGEELFLLEQNPDDSITFTIKAFSKPASALARAGGPITRWIQLAMTNRYLEALDS